MANLIKGVLGGSVATQVIVSEVYNSTGNVVLAGAALLVTVMGAGLAAMYATPREVFANI